MEVKAEVIRPRSAEVLGLGTNRLFGVAWAGQDAVARVEVSTDDGRTWSDAALMGPQACLFLDPVGVPLGSQPRRDVCEFWRVQPPPVGKSSRPSTTRTTAAI